MNNGGDQKVWVSALNDPARIAPSASRKGPVRFYDTTLRDGEQTVGVALDPQQKLEIAKLLDSLGISRIEAGFPRVSADDAEAFGWSAARVSRRDLGIRPRRTSRSR